MLSYQALDRIADSHNPVLGAIWIVLALIPLLTRQWRLASARAGLGVACLLIAYGFMWIDGALHIWSRAGLDYSTHTAVAVALIATIGAISCRVGALAVVMFCLYVPLMLHQRYHTVVDVASTVLAVGIPVFLAAHLACGAVFRDRRAVAKAMLIKSSDS
ncbi:hypothetical protein [Cupriavidus sp. AcVe19-6a]|uniref:hypothetical protein n=1 Tax=Cupriavidus sp. AcVe19-6a TaxID=2821358 RepID=UPI001AE80F7C|nr:hypothetical protein [Cupriavidus sp. AcVe19-6a]MBP0639335.1 hypothetical protein [Cupriavidus sp. AcVe19-6a]